MSTQSDDEIEAFEEEVVDDLTLVRQYIIEKIEDINKQMLLMAQGRNALMEIAQYVKDLIIARRREI